MNFVPIKIDYSIDNDGHITILDIGDGRSCGDAGFIGIDQAIEEKAFSIAPHAYMKAILDCEVTDEALTNHAHPIVFSSYSNPKTTIWPISGGIRVISQSLHTHGHYQLSANTHPSTLILSEQHKLYLYILRDQLPEAKRFVFWHDKKCIEETLTEIERLNIPAENGFFVKTMDNSNGGARDTEVMYVKDTKTLAILLQDLKRYSPEMSYAIEQVFADTKKNRNGKEYVVTGRAFIMLNQKEDHHITAEVIDAKYMFPSNPYQGKYNGTTKQFLANINKGQSTLLPLSATEMSQLSEQLNAERLKPLWQNLFEPVSKIDKMISEKNIAIHKKFLKDCKQRPYCKNKIDFFEKNSKPSIPVEYLSDQYFTCNFEIMSVNNSIDKLNMGYYEGSDIKKNIASLSHTLGAVSVHMRMISIIQNMGQSDYLKRIFNPHTFEKLIDTLNRNMHKLLIEHSSIQTKRLQAMVSKDTGNDKTMSITERDMECTIGCPELNIEPGKPFAYSIYEPTALAQAAKLGDFTIARALLLSRQADISVPAEYGEHAFFYGLSAIESETAAATKQILFAAIRDKQDRWSIPTSQTDKNKHLNAIYDCWFFEKLSQDKTVFAQDQLVNLDLIQNATDYRKLLQQQVQFYLTACNIPSYNYDNCNKALRNAVVQADVETTRILILTGLADPLHVSASGKSATDYADERAIKSKSDDKTVRKQIQSFIHAVNNKKRGRRRFDSDGMHEDNQNIRNIKPIVQGQSFFESEAYEGEKVTAPPEQKNNL